MTNNDSNSISETPEYKEALTSQAQAIHLCMRLGYKLLSPAEADELRDGRTSDVLLRKVTRRFLQKHGTYHMRSRVYNFSAAEIERGLDILRVVDDTAGLAHANQKKYEHICFPPAITVRVDGQERGFAMPFVDFENPENNEFHAVPEFVVQRAGSTDTCRLDLVLFVNGIPFGVIECKRSGIEQPMREAINQLRRYQEPGAIEQLFVYAQVLGACSVTEAKYGTTGLQTEFWAAWTKEEDPAIEAAVKAAIESPLSVDEASKVVGCLRITGIESAAARAKAIEAARTRGATPTAQDKMLASVFSTRRLLDLVRHFTVFDAGTRKAARHQQYFCVRDTMKRIESAVDGKTQFIDVGGIVYHTQGSGKTLTAVMLAEQILQEVEAARIVLVTDRVDLNDQIYKNFRAAGHEPHQVESGRDLAEHLTRKSTRVLTTTIHKFPTVVQELQRMGQKMPERVFVLVDEAHRTQFGELAARMRQAFPSACFIGFTGTPVTKQGRDVFKVFGGPKPIHTYNIKDATADGAVVPLVYEGRMIPQQPNQTEIDKWFDRYTAGLSSQQLADLRRKYTRLAELHQSAPRLRVLAFDIVKHFTETFAGTGLKGQVVVDSRADAVALLEQIKTLGGVRAVVVMSEPDASALQDSRIKVWWDEQIKHYKKPEQYEKQTIQAFKDSDDIDLVIVVDKLLVGFDAPRNAVLYLAKPLKDHTLLQAIARVNRLSPGKQVGLIVDYQGVLRPLTEAMGEYTTLGSEEEFDSSDLEGTLKPVTAVIAELSEAAAECDRFFDGVDKNDEEAVDLSFADEDRRADFYGRIRVYGACLHAALASPSFLEQSKPADISAHKLRLKWLTNLRVRLQRRYAEKVDFAEYEPKIRKLLDEYIKAKDVEVVVRAFSLFDTKLFDEEIEKMKTPAAKAYTIANRVKKTITEKMDEDPTLFKRFSEMVENAISQYESKRLSDAEFLKRMQEIVQGVRTRTIDEAMPAAVATKPVAQAYWRNIKAVLEREKHPPIDEEFAADLAVEADALVEEKRKVNWVRDENIVNQLELKIGDLVYDRCGERGVTMTLDLAESIAKGIVGIAKEQRA
jgi:type I restriction enzyme, R subunit